MDSEFELVTENFYALPIFGEDSDTLDENAKKFSLSLFTFFGTLVWGESSILYDYNRIILSSPTSKENLILLKNSGYTICVIEFVPKKKLQNFKKMIEIFYQSLCNKISVHFFVYTEKNVNILEGLNLYFNPENSKFGKNSFYCGIEVDKYDEFPWFRKSNKDVKLAKQLSMKFYNPNSVLGSHENKGYFKSTLYIVCGPDYSGWEIELASFKDTVKYENIEFKYKKENDVEIYAIESEDLLSLNIHETLLSVENKAIIVFGRNPTFEERENLRGYFINYFLTIVHWYSRYPYKKSDTFPSYTKFFKNPLLYAEFFERIT
jgi:hypothetical protein